MDEQARKILWKCRRGSLELDLILSNFFQQQYPYLTKSQLKTFDQLLDQQDPQLTSWIFGEEIPPKQDFAELIQLIKVKLTC